jgi:hypothetical protein
MDEIAAQCAWAGRAALAKRLRECAGAANGDALVSCVKLASPKRPVCVELAAVWTALFAVAGIECSAQRALDTDGADLRCTDRLSSLSSILLVVGGGTHFAVDALATVLARFTEMRLRELVVVVAGDTSPYVVAERVRCILGEPSEITTSAVRSSFRVGALSVLVAREPLDVGAFSLALLLAPSSVRVHPDTIVFAVRGESLVCAGVPLPLTAYVPDHLISDPAARVAMMDRVWDDAVRATVPADVAEVRAVVAECFARAGRLLGTVDRSALVVSVISRVRLERAPHVRDDWHGDLALAAARLAIVVLHNAASFLSDEREHRRVAPALAVLVEADHSLTGTAILLAAFAALDGAHFRALQATCVFTEIVPAPSTTQELLCALFALYRVRLQTVRDAESALGIGRALHAATSVVRSGTLLRAELRVTRETTTGRAGDRIYS